MSLELMANARKLFAQCPINLLSLLPQYVPTALLGSLLHAIVVRQQLHGNHERSIQAVRIACVVSFQITKPGNVNRQKIFVGILDHEIFLRENLKRITRKISRSATVFLSSQH